MFAPILNKHFANFMYISKEWSPGKIRKHIKVSLMSKCNIYRGAKFYHNCNQIVRSSRYIVFDRKSIPIVAWSSPPKKKKKFRKIKHLLVQYKKMPACSKRINSQLIIKFKTKKQLIKQRKEGAAITKEIFFYKTQLLLQ